MKKKINMLSDEDKLKAIRGIYGDKVSCTKGLFHIYDENDGMEMYIEPNRYKLDKRGKYRTTAVLENTVVSQLLTSPTIRYVILDKKTLELIFKTKGVVKVVSKQLILCKEDKVTKIISMNGKILFETTDDILVEPIGIRYYILKNKKMFSDHIAYYSEYSDTLSILSEDKNYDIQRIYGVRHTIEVVIMHGGRYRYSFDSHKCFNIFTMKEENSTFLWAIV